MKSTFSLIYKKAKMYLSAKETERTLTLIQYLIYAGCGHVLMHTEFLLD